MGLVEAPVPNRHGDAHPCFGMKRTMCPCGATVPLCGADRHSAPILRYTLVLPREVDVTSSAKLLREEHSLVARVFGAAQSANAHRILLVSAHSGDGKTHFARCIQRHASAVTNETSMVQSFTAPLSKAELEPTAEPAHGYVWVDGLALLEGEGAAALTPSVRANFDGALLIARGMTTTRAQVAACADQLRVLGLPMLGGVWNELECPSPAETLRRIKAGLRTWPPQLPPGVITRQLRRSS